MAKIHAQITDRRRDHLHKLTTRLVRENQTLMIEDLTVRNMLKNRRLARSIGDAAWGELRQMLEYETAWYGRELIAVDWWFPSSKLCSSCGAVTDLCAPRDDPRPGRERSDQPLGRRAGGVCLWSGRKSSAGALPDGAARGEAGSPTREGGIDPFSLGKVARPSNPQ
ncbi:hypothetical protein KPP03845_104699 [Streptomyces xanthophaeus]|nr:hypothetical protein KPP03845_104699 [Streptomyces xanthophaeus]